MAKENSSVKNSFILFVTLLFVYIVMFEFILPINKFLPKPGLLVESFTHVLRDYNLIYALTISTTVIYLMLTLGLVFIYFGIGRLTKLFVEFEGSILSLRLFRYLPAFFFAVIFNFWFPGNILGEFIFAFVLVLFLLSKIFFEETKNVKEEYLLVARNLNLTYSDIYKKIYWKSALPNLFESLRDLHYYLWMLVLVYEFIGNSFGFGSIYRASLEYNDFTALFILVIVNALLIWFGDFLIASLKRKLIHWTA